MNSLKNDFIIIENINSNKLNILKIANRKTGIGCDQIFIINNVFKNIINYKIFNSDASQAKACGNGLRCLSKLISMKYHIKYFISKVEFNKLEVFFKKNKSKIKFHFYLNFNKIGFIFNNKVFFMKIKKNILRINYLKKNIKFYLVSVGNPHLIYFTNLKIKEIFSLKKFFKYGINISKYYKNKFITFERGAGYTKSCGTATTCLSIIKFLKDLIKKFNLKKFGESIKLYWKGKNSFSKKRINMVGSGNFVFKGNFDENKFKK
ncbi:hypothetical protein [Candidatus Vidania fulgoroideorum]